MGSLLSPAPNGGLYNLFIALQTPFYYFSLHKAEPTSGTLNEIAGYSRLRLTFDSNTSYIWSDTKNGFVRTYGALILNKNLAINVPANTTITHIGVLTSSGTLIAYTAFNPPEVFVGAGIVSIAPIGFVLINYDFADATS